MDDASPGGTTLDRDRTEMKDAVEASCRLLHTTRKAALATALSRRRGWPYASLVTVACDLDLSPILLMSELAEHTRSLIADPRIALLYDVTEGYSNPQVGPRVTVMARARASDDPAHRHRFLARHPGAELYAGFADFRIWRVAVERVHYVGGFVRARWLSAADVIHDPGAVAPLRAVETRIIAHMNEDNADGLNLMAKVLLRRRGREWRMSGIDPEGIDLVRRG